MSLSKINPPRYRDRGGRGGRLPVEYARAFRARRIALLNEAAKYAPEAIDKRALMRNDAGDVPYSEQRKASQWIAEMSMGKPLQAADLGMEQSEHKTLTVRWLPPDPNDRSRYIEPEPD